MTGKLIILYEYNECIYIYNYLLWSKIVILTSKGATLEIKYLKKILHNIAYHMYFCLTSIIGAH